MTRPRDPDRKRSKRRKKMSAAAKAVWAGLGLLFVWVFSIWPGTTIMPASMVKWRLDQSMPVFEPKNAWEARGEYVVTVAGCAMCHTAYSWIGPHHWKPLVGGMRVRWNNALGERVAQNLTPDPETGIGNWTEEDFIAAMKSGLYPDGRAAHWQAMPWDMHSNWSLDDMRAMYRYLMALPAAKRPESKPIDGPLPSSDTFYFGA
jgi:hypothetical protein